MDSVSEPICSTFTAAELVAPGLLEIYGEPDSGKTPLALQIALHYPQVIFFDLERKGVPEGLGREGMLIVQPDTAEEACAMLRRLLGTGSAGIVLDTLAALSLAATLKADYQPQQEHYRLSRFFVQELRKVLMPIYQSSSQLILVNQLRELDDLQSYRPLGRHYPLFCAKQVWVRGLVVGSFQTYHGSVMG